MKNKIIFFSAFLLSICMNAQGDTGPFGGIHPCEFTDSCVHHYMEPISIALMLVLIVVVEITVLRKYLDLTNHSLAINIPMLVIILNIATSVIGYYIYKDGESIVTLYDFIKAFSITTGAEMLLAVTYISFRGYLQNIKDTVVAVGYANIASYLTMLPMWLLLRSL